MGTSIQHFGQEISFIKVYQNLVGFARGSITLHFPTPHTFLKYLLLVIIKKV